MNASRKGLSTPIRGTDGGVRLRIAFVLERFAHLRGEVPTFVPAGEMGPREPRLRGVDARGIVEGREEARELLEVLEERGFFDRFRGLVALLFRLEEEAFDVIAVDAGGERDVFDVREEEGAVSALLHELEDRRNVVGRFVVEVDGARLFAAPKRAHEGVEIEGRRVEVVEEDRLGREGVEGGRRVPRRAVRAEKVGIDTIDRETENIGETQGGALTSLRACYDLHLFFFGLREDNDL